MALTLFASHTLEQLSAQLQEQLRAARPAVFQPYYIVTQTEGMNTWLKTGIASNKNIGIAANIRFLKPNDLVHTLYKYLGGSYAPSFSSDHLSWLIYRLLGETEFLQRFPAIAEYYLDDPCEEVKRMSLASKLADLFDQYQIYRPDYIHHWKNGKAEFGPHEDWQEYLWTKARALAGDRLSDKTEQAVYILEKLRDPNEGERLQRQFGQIHVFGISITTPYHLQILHRLADHLDVIFYLQNPAPTQYWFDTVHEKQLETLLRKGFVQPGEVESGNNLLLGWGKVIRDTYSLLFKYEDFLNAYQELPDEAPEADTLLHLIQQDVYYNRNTEKREEVDPALLDDGSVTVNACYTIAREVESLYNYLVHLVDEREEQLSPRDVVVMVTDIDAYAPYIKAVFDNAPYRFKYSIADEGYAGNDSIVHALSALLQLTEGGFRAESILQLLDSSWIRERFGIHQVALIRKAVDRANIRFGIEGKREDDTVYVSWEYGLKRLLFGLCLGGEEAYTYEGEELYPVDLVEGAESLELVRFCHFVRTLVEALKQRKRDRPIADWVEHVKWLVQQLVYEVEDSVEEDYAVLLQQLQAYNTLFDLVEEPVSFDVFAQDLLQSLSHARRNAAFAGGGITFCSLVPMRSIPFKVVALMGMNSDKFPRRETPVPFSLLTLEKRTGDRNIKDNDKHLFLETLLSAREYLYISYVGQSAKDNSSLPPSALVDELFDYIQRKCQGQPDVRKALVQVQPLHSFSRRYTVDGELYNYLIERTGDNSGLIDMSKSPEPFKTEEIQLESFVAFFKNPFKAYYNRVLDIRYEDENELLREEEIFELDSLQSWNLKWELLSDEDQVENWRDRLVRTGKLPLKNMAGVALQEVQEDVELVKALLKEEDCEGLGEQLALEHTVSGITIRGVLKPVYKGKLVTVCFSNREIRYQLDAYLRYLVGRAAGLLEGVYYISKKDGALHKAAPITPAEAQQRLEALVQLYVQGHRELVYFYPNLKVDPAKLDGVNELTLIDAVEAALENEYGGLDDPYLLSEYRDERFRGTAAGKQYIKNCELLLKPLPEVFPGCFEK